MRLGIMQPYFFPYFGHFQLIALTDRWIIFDVVKYGRKTWMNRNRILKPGGGWQYISVPVHAEAAAAVKDVRMVSGDRALARILGQLDHYRRHAPYFEAVVDLVRRAFAGAREARLVELNRRGLTLVCDYIGLPFAPSLCSELDLCLGAIEHPGQWALHICKQLGADSYLNPESGRHLFRPEEWLAAGISLQFLRSPEFRFDCGCYVFEADLSILDVLMWNSPATVLAALKSAAAARVDNAS